MAVLKSETLLSLMTIPVESPYTSAIATLTRPVVAFWPLTVEFSIVTPVVCCSLMLNVPPATTWTFLTVTLEAVIVRTPGMDRPLSTVPFTSR